MMKVTPCFSVSFGIKSYPDFIHLFSLIPLVFITNVLCTHVCHCVYQYEATALQTNVIQGHFFSGSLTLYGRTPSTRDLPIARLQPTQDNTDTRDSA